MHSNTQTIALNNKGAQSFMRADFQAAEENYRKALELDQSNSTAQNNLGLLYHQQSQFEKAVAQFRKAIGIKEKDIYYLNLANSLVNLKLYDEAESAYLKSLDLNPENSNAIVSLARFYIHSNKLKSASWLLENFAHSTGNPLIYLEWAKTLIGLKRYRKALEILGRLGHDNEQGSVSQNIGICEFHLKNFGCAQGSFKSALALAPDNRISRHFLALTYLAQGEFEAALRHLSHLVRTYPNHLKYRLDQVAILLQIQKWDEAFAELKYILGEEPENEKALRYMKFIKENSTSQNGSVQKAIQ